MVHFCPEFWVYTCVLMNSIATQTEGDDVASATVQRGVARAVALPTRVPRLFGEIEIDIRTESSRRLKHTLPPPPETVTVTTTYSPSATVTSQRWFIHTLPPPQLRSAAIDQRSPPPQDNRFATIIRPSSIADERSPAHNGSMADILIPRNTIFDQLKANSNLAEHLSEQLRAAQANVTSRLSFPPRRFKRAWHKGQWLRNTLHIDPNEAAWCSAMHFEDLFCRGSVLARPWQLDDLVLLAHKENILSADPERLQQVVREMEIASNKQNWLRSHPYFGHAKDKERWLKELGTTSHTMWCVAMMMEDTACRYMLEQ
ncbi:hypothetical protein ANO11243_048270 [Dothideomycetidae sp. 11243]|nr:hypothetical protein ANO11243_048270 [fungal sp. No.11243]